MPDDKPIINSNREDFNLVKALFVASITFYGKLFTQAKGRKIKLDKLIYNSEEDKKLHDELMEFRHGYTAHSGEENIENVNIIIAIPPDKKAKLLPHLICELSQPDSTSNDEIVHILAMVNRLHEKIKDKIEILTNQVFNKDVLMKGLKYWHNK